MRLTDKGRLAVAKLRSRYKVLDAEYGCNAADRLVFERQGVPSCVIMYALDRASPDDLAQMVRYGYADKGD